MSLPPNCLFTIFYLLLCFVLILFSARPVSRKNQRILTLARNRSYITLLLFVVTPSGVPLPPMPSRAHYKQAPQSGRCVISTGTCRMGFSPCCLSERVGPHGLKPILHLEQHSFARTFLPCGLRPPVEMTVPGAEDPANKREMQPARRRKAN